MVMQGQTSIVAGARTNVLAGLLYEFCPFDAAVDFFLTGAASGELRATIQTGNNVVMDESQFSVAARMPVKPDDFTMRDVVRRGEKIQLWFRNTGAGANIGYWCVDIKPLRAR